MLGRNSNLDDILGRTIEDASSTLLDVNQLVPFENHPFRPYTENKMDEMVASIQEHGILSPLLIRPLSTGKYEIISGHNRWEAAKRIGLREVPAVIKELDDETAAIMMVDANFNQREEVLPSEKAFAYKIKLDAIRRKAGRPLNNCGHGDHNYDDRRSRDIIAEESGESGTKISRYIRLTQLIPALLERVDDGRLGFIPAVDLSYLSEEQQEYVEDIMGFSDVKPSKAQAAELKKRSQAGGLTKKEMKEILSPKKVSLFSSWKANTTFKSMLPENIQKDLTADRADEILKEAMQLWNEKHSQKKMNGV